MTKPIRLQLSRKKGFNLQAHSKAANGIDAVNVARPSKWGNPFTVAGALEAGYKPESCQSMAVYAHHQCIVGNPDYYNTEDLIACRDFVKANIADLRGKNLACWCKPGDPCHADTLLKLANKEEDPNG